MRALALRTLSPAEMAWRKILAGWRDHHIAAMLARPEPHRAKMAIAADNGSWRALVDPREWLAAAAPALASMAVAACDDDKIMALFTSLPRPLTFEHDALPYRKIHIEGMVSGSGALPLPCLSARECALWVTELSPGLAMAPAATRHLLRDVRLPMVLVLGASPLKAALAATLAIGDVLLIAHETRLMKYQGRTLGRFRQNEDVMMIDEHYEDDYNQDAIEPGYTQPDALSGALASLPLTLEFILQRRHLSIGQVQQLFAGQILEMDPACEKNIEIRSNGRLLASGELVQLNDRLGVEVRDLHPDEPHAK